MVVALLNQLPSDPSVCVDVERQIGRRLQPPVSIPVA